jgi:hypothetical protein
LSRLISEVTGGLFAAEVDTGLLVGGCCVLMKGLFCLFKMGSKVEGSLG